MAGIPIYTLSAINPQTANPSETRRTTEPSIIATSSDSTPVGKLAPLLPRSRKRSSQPRIYPPERAIPPFDHVPRQSLGYQQNVYAAEPGHEARRAMEAAASRDKNEIGNGTKAEIAWNTAKIWAVTAGEKVVETEKTMWRRMSKT